MSNTPQLLTKSAIKELAQGFDAGDVLECYLLQRIAPLNGFHNLPVVKHVLAIRYIPPANAKHKHANDRPLSLTLEYGPMRVGPDQQHEAIPILEETHVSWDNHARVYYTNTINSTQFKSANYMTSLTGSVLENLLQAADEYSLLKPRYQPFTVKNPQTDKILLRSHSDLDFVNAMWRYLATLGVDLAPVLQPVNYQLRLYATNITRIEAIGEDRIHIFEFYDKLYHCLDRIASGMTPTVNNTMHETTMAPSPSPRYLQEESNAPTISQTPTSAPSDPIDHSDQAQHAADQAHQAAQDAKDAGNDQAAEAASKAADAAQKAADVTANQQASINQKNLLSGDGAAVSRAIIPCLHQTNSTIEPIAYVYIDGTFFFRIALVSPFIDVTQLVDYKLPQPPKHDGYTGGDAVDWSLFFLLCGLLFFGVILFIQQLVGDKCTILLPVYRLQRWFFDPLHHSYEAIDNNDGRNGEGVRYPFGEDVIPLSMGGRKPPSFHDNGALAEEYHDEGLEMADLGFRDSGDLSYHGSTHSVSYVGDDDDILMDTPIRIGRKREPDHVELPNLSSSSKVAVPVSLIEFNNGEDNNTV